MKKFYLLACLCLCIAVFLLSFRKTTDHEVYSSLYWDRLREFSNAEVSLKSDMLKADLTSSADIDMLQKKISATRVLLKKLDFWFRYLEPVAYKKINGPLPVEWETEVFEKFEKPYKRPGAGLTLASLYLEDSSVSRDSLVSLIDSSLVAMNTFGADSITSLLKNDDHFYLSNRLFLLNLAAIYTTGFECPDTSRIIPELAAMLSSVGEIYSTFDKTFPESALSEEYLALFNKMQNFVATQPVDYSSFDHYSFIKDFVNPLFAKNQVFITDYKIISKSFVDYTLTRTSRSIFDKNLYNGQNAKGIFLRIKDPKVLEEISSLGKMLFYDPILSGNLKRSCASCHKSTEFFADSSFSTPLQYDGVNRLPRNAPSLVNSQFNHLIMLDGKHISLQDQAKDVILNPLEMSCNEKDLLKRVLSCDEYKDKLKNLLTYTPQEPEVTLNHLLSAITYYYSSFGQYYSPFDDDMNGQSVLEPDAKLGFNLFMSKAQCATCHFVPQFNGVKPPYVGSEFEVLGVPSDTSYRRMGTDRGRFQVNPAPEMDNAFRTGTIRNAARTMPYMHNGIFRSLSEVIDFYDAGGGVGKGMSVPNQTLSSDSLHLTVREKSQLLAFMVSLNERIPIETAPAALPASKNKTLNKRSVGGEY